MNPSRRPQDTRKNTRDYPKTARAFFQEGGEVEATSAPPVPIDPKLMAAGTSADTGKLLPSKTGPEPEDVGLVQAGPSFDETGPSLKSIGRPKGGATRAVRDGWDYA